MVSASELRGVILGGSRDACAAICCAMFGPGAGADESAFSVSGAAVLLRIDFLFGTMTTNATSRWEVKGKAKMWWWWW